VKGLALPDAETIRAWIEPGLRRQRASAEPAEPLTASQRALHAAIGDRSILDIVPDTDFAASKAASLRARG
jgi:hypothetical protein